MAKPWNEMTDEERVADIMGKRNAVFLDVHGGYPTVYEIRWGHVIHAIASEEGEASLEITPIKQWIRENRGVYE